MVEGKGEGGEGDRRKARRQAFFRAYLIVELLGHSDDAGLGLLPQESMGRGLRVGWELGAGRRGPDWQAGLGRAGLGWAGLGWAGLGCHRRQLALSIDDALDQGGRGGGEPGRQGAGRDSWGARVRVRVRVRVRARARTRARARFEGASRTA